MGSTNDEINPALFKSLRAYVTRRLGAVADVDDIVQETLTRLVKRQKAQPLDQGGTAPYAMRIAQNLLTDRYRGAATPHVELTEEIRDAAPLHDNTVIARDELKAIMAVVDAMPPLRRTVFARVRLDGQTHKQIEADLGLSRRAIEQHMTRALVDIAKARRTTNAATNAHTKIAPTKTGPSAAGGPTKS